MSRSYVNLRNNTINKNNAFHNILSNNLSPFMKNTGVNPNVDPMFTGRIISGDPSFNNINVYGKLEVNNFHENFVTYGSNIINPLYTFSDKNNVTFCGVVTQIFLPNIVEHGRTLQISNMTSNKILLKSSEETRMYHWIMTPADGLSEFDVYPNMFLRLIYTENTLTNIGKWSIVC